MTSNEYTSLADMLNKCGIGESYQFSDYTIEDVIEAIKLYLNDNGKRPTNNSERIPYPPFDNKITWQCINSTSPIVKKAGYTSIRDICDKNNLGHSFKRDYTIENVKKVVADYFRDHGKKPTNKSGKINYSPFNGMKTWAAFDKSRILKEAGYKSLADFCEKNGFSDTNVFVDYTLKDIETAIIYYINEHSQRPTKRSGVIDYPPFNGKTSWANVEKIKIFKEAGYKSIADFCAKNSLGKPHRFLDYSIQDVKSAINSYILDNNKRPTENSGPIPYVPFNNDCTWQTVGKSKILKDAGYKSIADFCEQNDLGDAHYFTNYTIEDIKNAVTSYISDHGKRPHAGSGLIPYPPFNSMATWAGVNASTTLKEAGYKSLFVFCNKYGHGEASRFIDYTIEDIYSAALAYTSDHGHRPVQRSGKIPYPPFSNRVTWSSIDMCKTLKEAGYKSLADYCNKQGYKPKKRAIQSSYTILDIKSATQAYIAEHGRRPTQRSGKISYPPFEYKATWKAINRSRVLKEAGYASLLDFCEKNDFDNIPKYDSTPEPM